jgi:hypothetical protein
MQTIKIHEGQTLIDIAMQYCGDALAVFDVADLNALGVTDDLIPGQTILIPDVAIDKIKVVEAFEGLTPASSYNDEDIELTWESAGALVITKEGTLKKGLTVGEGQTLIDIAMQFLGDASRAFEIADLNGLSITDNLTPGQTLIIPEPAIDKIKIVAAFAGLQPASMDDENVLDEVFDGIDYWAIEEDFIVQEG